jgi:hypothetical protein
MVFLLIIISASAFSCFVRRENYDSSYSKIDEGASKEEVVKLYGKPTEVTNCSNYKRPGVKDEIQRNCVEVYWYRTPLEQWIFFLGKDGRVISKAYNVLG